jgi:hypothetical protein
MVISQHITEVVASTRIADLQRVAADRRVAADLREPRIKRVRTFLLRRAQKHRPTLDRRELAALMNPASPRAVPNYEEKTST